MEIRVSEICGGRKMMILWDEGNTVAVVCTAHSGHKGEM